MSEKNRESRIGAVILMISAAVFIVTSAVAVPILARPILSCTYTAAGFDRKKRDDGESDQRDL